MDFTTHYASPLGGITIACEGSGSAIVGVWFDDQRYFADVLDGEHEEREAPVFEQTRRWLDVYFKGREPDFTPPIELRGTAFRRTVWAELRTIPYGQSTTYGAIADKLSSSPRAVGGAVGHNPVSLIVPCHRVVGSAGRMTGYAGGIDRKIVLLALEGTILPI